MNFVELQSYIVRRLDPPRPRHVAVMFADLDHFTRICAEDPPECAFRLVKDFQHIVADAVSRFKGSLNLYLGDGAMATFGDLAGRTDCATRALRCAQTILAQIAALNLEHINSGGRSVSISIGLQYGQVFVGSISSSRRFGPTVIGDAVNVANRLEQRAQTLKAKVVVGNDLVQKVRSESGLDASELAQFVHLGPLAVHGRDTPVNVWTLSTLARPAAGRSTDAMAVGSPPASITSLARKPGRRAKGLRGSGARLPNGSRDIMLGLVFRRGLAWFAARQ